MNILWTTMATDPGDSYSENIDQASAAGMTAAGTNRP